MYRKVKSEEIFDGKILNLKLEYFEKEDKVLRREIVDHKDAVAIFPIDEKGYVYLVKQYRFPIQEDFLEIPAGLVEVGENYEETALRELQEEIGFSSNNLEKIFEGYTSVGFCTEKVVVYRADSLFSSKLPEDEDENLSIVKIHFDELKKMYFNGEIKDFKTAIAILNEINRG